MMEHHLISNQIMSYSKASCGNLPFRDRYPIRDSAASGVKTSRVLFHTVPRGMPKFFASAFTLAPVRDRFA